MLHFKRLLNILLLLLVLIHTYRLFVESAAQGASADLATYLSASKRLYSGLNIYNHIYDDDLVKMIYGAEAPADAAFEIQYFYPPFLAILLGRLSRMDFSLARQYWAWLNYCALLISAAVFAVLTKNSIAGKYALLTRFNGILLLFSIYDPFYVTFAEGQVNLLVLTFIACFLLFWEKGWHLLSGLMLCFPTLFKMSPVLLALGPLRAGKYKILAVYVFMCASAVALLLLSTISIDSYRGFFTFVSRLSSGEIAYDHEFNLALGKSFLVPFSLQESPVLHDMIIIIIAVITLTFIIKSNICHACYARHVTSLLTMAMILLSPITWAHHLIWLFLPFLSLLSSDLENPKSAYFSWVLCAGLYVFLGKSYTMQGYVFIHAPRLIPLINLFLNGALLLLAFLVAKRVPLKAPHAAK